MVAVPCGHAVLCPGCASQVEERGLGAPKCPMCRVGVDRWVRNYS